MPQSPLARACPRCGSPLKTATLYGMRAVLCARCDVVIVARRDLDNLAGRETTEEAATEEAPRHGSTSGRPAGERDLWASFAPEPHSSSTRASSSGSPVRTAILTAAIVAVGLGVLLPAAFFAGSYWKNRAAAPVEDQAVIAATVPGTPPAPPKDEPAAVAAPAVAVEAEPAPVEVPKGPSAKQLIARGWEQVDRGDASTAEASFRAALDKKPGDAEATYGVGYALVRQQRVPEGRDYLCRALKMGASTDLQREIAGLLEANKQTCD